jgi:hypothetical protein
MRMGVPDGETADPAGQVEQAITVNVGNDGAERRVGDERRLNGHRSGDGAQLSRQDLARARAGKLG